MAVVSVTRADVGWTGSAETGPKQTYNVPYLVETDDIDDGPNIAMSASALPSLGSFYSSGNDSSPLATLKNFSAARHGDTLTWLVIAHYTTADGNAEEPDDNPTGDPLQEPADINIRFVSFWTEVEKGYPLQDVGFAAKEGVGLQTISNSAGDDIEPKIQRYRTHQVVTIARNEPNYVPELGQFMYTINDRDWSIDHRGLFVSAPKHHALISDIQADRRFERGVAYWRVRYEIALDLTNLSQDETSIGWNIEIKDEGWGWRQHNLTGQKITSQAEYDASIYRRASDLEGNVVGKQFPLDGSGNKLDNWAIWDSALHKFEWRIYEEKNFNLLGLP